MQHSQNKTSPEALCIPPGLTDADSLHPLYFIDCSEYDLSDSDTIKKINEILFQVLCQVHYAEIEGKTLTKVHIGEPKCITRMRPEYVTAGGRFLRYRGADVVVAGDTTVAYTGFRGHRQNADGGAGSYMKLARLHGWSPAGAAGMPFVVLDRPDTAAQSGFSFSEAQRTIHVGGIRRFSDFFQAGGFAAADFIINHAHLTLHGLAGVAGCIKSIAMGCTSLEGKLRMHKSLLPCIDGSLCRGCGECVRNCPEQALGLSDDDFVVLEAEKCIGCGECVAVCPAKAVRLQGREVNDWKLGEETLPERMADYTVGLMNGRWENTIHILHMYSVTELCDCVSRKQKPFVRDIGFLVGKNPFAVDETSGTMLARAVEKEGAAIDRAKLESASRTAAYVRKEYGILTDAPLQHIQLTDAALPEF